MMNVNGSGFTPQYIPPADLGPSGGVGNNSGAVNNNNSGAGALSMPLTVTFSAAPGITPVDFGSPSVSGVNGPTQNNAPTNPLQSMQGQDGAAGAGGGQMAELMNMIRQLLSELLKMLGGGDNSDQQNSTPSASSGGSGGSAAPSLGDGGGGGPSVGNNLLAQPGAGAGAANGASGASGASGAGGAGATSGMAGLSGSGNLHLPPQLEPYRQSINNAAQATGMPASVIAGQIWAESRGNLSAASTNGGNGKTDAGLMQVNPDTYNEMAKENPGLLSGDPNSAQNNIMAGALYLKQQTNAFGGNIGAGLRAYNSGPDDVNLSNLSDISKTGTGAAPYVDNVLSFAKIIESGQGQLPA
ncbi:lytic transglycosylase domain-containing protein [Ewingella sp. AOP8-B2-18]